MSAGKDGIQSFVAHVRRPTIEALVQVDAPSFDAITEVLTRLFEVSVSYSQEAAGTSFYSIDRSGPILTIGKVGGVVVHDPIISKRVNALLRAARIHFVESYDWVILPPRMRTDLVEEEASEVGLSADDFKKLLSKWTD